MFDHNPKATPADRFIAGKTTEAIVRAIAPAIGNQTVGTVPVPGSDPLMVAEIVNALLGRFDRKAERRAAVEDAA